MDCESYPISFQIPNTVSSSKNVTNYNEKGINYL